LMAQRRELELERVKIEQEKQLQTVLHNRS
jgi:hypothetical protein